MLFKSLTKNVNKYFGAKVGQTLGGSQPKKESVQ